VVAPDQCVGVLPLAAVVIPEVADATGRPLRIPASVAARALAASTSFQMAGTRTETLSLIRRVVEGLPAYSVAVGPDVALVPERLEGCFT
jgi:hypothetical protein